MTDRDAKILKTHEAAIERAAASLGIPEYLLNTKGCERRVLDVCGGECGEAVKPNAADGRWFITMGHPGFNSPANNCRGYGSKGRALAAIRFYNGRTRRLMEKTVEVREGRS